LHEEVIENFEALNYSILLPQVLSRLAIAYYHLGVENKSYDFIEEKKTIEVTGVSPSYCLATTYAQMDEIDEAFKCLGKAYKDHEMGMYSLKH